MSRVDDVLKKYGFPRNAQTTWQVQGNAVIYHAVLEQIARDLEIMWDRPVILRAEEDECVILVSGVMDGKVEWTIGEAKVGVNYRVSGKQAAYVYAMAEKRAKDRLIYKFLGLQEYFDDSAAAENPAENKKPVEQLTRVEKFGHNITRRKTRDELNDLIKSEPFQVNYKALSTEERAEVDRIIAEQRTVVGNGATSRETSLWDSQLERAKAALAKAKNVKEVESYERMILEQEFSDAPQDVIDAFKTLVDSRRYQMS
jgi:hypothetical protein